LCQQTKTKNIKRNINKCFDVAQKLHPNDRKTRFIYLNFNKTKRVFYESQSKATKNVFRKHFQEEIYSWSHYHLLFRCVVRFIQDIRDLGTKRSDRFHGHGRTNNCGIKTGAFLDTHKYCNSIHNVQSLFVRGQSSTETFSTWNLITVTLN
jgi:hypothetical protein